MYKAPILSSEEAPKKLSLLCLEILQKRASISYPNGSRGVPSSVVVVRGSYAISIDRDQWRLAVVPVLENPSFSLIRTVRGREIERTKDWSQFEKLLEEALKKSFKSAGY